MRRERVEEGESCLGTPTRDVKKWQQYTHCAWRIFSLILFELDYAAGSRDHIQSRIDDRPSRRFNKSLGFNCTGIQIFWSPGLVRHEIQAHFLACLNMA